jgi:hypothetical protein
MHVAVLRLRSAKHETAHETRPETPHETHAPTLDVPGAHHTGLVKMIDSMGKRQRVLKSLVFKSLVLKSLVIIIVNSLDAPQGRVP